jgi:translation elongation factor aEF-1 beta
MPTSPSVDMKKLQENVEKRVKEIGGILHKVDIEPIAFGLKALVFMIGWKEELDPDLIESELAKIKDVNSIEITDVRRAIG